MRGRATGKVFWRLPMFSAERSGALVRRAAALGQSLPADGRGGDAAVSAAAAVSRNLRSADPAGVFRNDWIASVR